MSDVDLKAAIIKRADEMRAGIGGTRYDVARTWVKRAADLCLKRGWWEELAYLKDSWALN